MAKIAQPSQLSQARMKRAAEDLVQLLEECLPAESLDWLQDDRPDLDRYLHEAKAALTIAAVDGDKKDFAEAIRGCASMFLQVAWICEREENRLRRMTYSGVSPAYAGAGIN